MRMYFDVASFQEFRKPREEENPDINLEQNGEPWVLIDIISVVVLAIMIPSPPAVEDDEEKEVRKLPYIMDWMVISLLYLALWRSDYLIVEGWKIGHQQHYY